MNRLKGVAIGAGYFSQFHFDAWSRIAEVDLTAVCDMNREASGAVQKKWGIPTAYTDVGEMLDSEKPDFVDIITRPDSHLMLVKEATRRGIPIICQKALAPTFDEAKQIVRTAKESSVPLMVHENFRFQPWYREIKRQIDSGAIGQRLHGISFRCRMGDGWQEDAYISRQPYFREMPRLLVFETGVHFIDSFRFLAGEIDGVYASLKKFNSDIAGEDAAAIHFDFSSGATAIWEGNRYNEPTSKDARLTFGSAIIDGSGGTIRLYEDGSLTLQPLGESERPIAYEVNDHGFAGDCVYATQRHFIDCLRSGQPFETSGEEYLKSLAVVEAVYESSNTKLPVRGLTAGGVAESTK